LTFLRSQKVASGLVTLFRSEVAGGLVLTGAALAALVWANSPWRHTYVRLWDHPVHLGGHGFTGFSTMQEWVNGGLMAVFFLVVGLEIARERRDGDLADMRTASFRWWGPPGGWPGPDWSTP
jgi:NhaA family Na+:H+ antiporter